MNYYFDLKQHFDMRMVYPKDTKLNEKSFIGTHNHFFNEEDYPFGIFNKEDISVKFERNKEFFDCIECKGQAIEVENINCNKITFAGFCAWGYFKENFLLEFMNGLTEEIIVHFFDWAWSPINSIKWSMEMESENLKNCSKTLFQRDRREGEAFMYYSISEINNKGNKLKRIIFPDNICMYISAITIA